MPQTTIKLRLGQKVEFSLYLKRTIGPASAIYDWNRPVEWKPVTLRLPIQGIIVGRRTLWNGYKCWENGDEEGQYYATFQQEKPVAAVLVATNLKSKPIPVALTDIIFL